MKPTSRTPNTMKAIQKLSQQDAVAPLKRRRQLTAQPVTPTNQFDRLTGLATKALKGY